MRITPLDIQQKQFPAKFRGFDEEEVDSFLELVREEMEELLRDNASLREETKKMEKQLKEYKSIESTLRDTLMATQQIVEEHKANAKKDAELIRKEAELKAEDMVRGAQEKVVRIHEDITDLKGVRLHFKEELKRLIESHLGMMEFDRQREEEKPDEV
ncbi:MAG TPA: DivIVA domain-containing protein [Nitrospirae bacterium]|nr:septum site-determining protein DivIVA [bacterium BMS3Abin10]GBE37722.1 septum site-determining protein DivIVA [bacterium BMS3Bbin08]HDH50711.1 DivIVA domain-containing protein [Nitrospirota bacterium]HDK17626.1 DivIVA domain-containing protein [Nitrospirota bacterium]HDK41732.1 DivIVA domain-containing protein [Nitrospirota bacterium]